MNRQATLGTLLVFFFIAATSLATTIDFEDAGPSSNADIPVDYGSFIAGNQTGFVTTDGTGATPNVGLTWVGNRPAEWEYHAGNAWSHYKTPVHVAQIDHNREFGGDDVSEIVFTPINGRAVSINSFVLIGGSGQGATSIFDWEILGTGVGGTLNVPVGGNTGAVPVNFTGTGGTEYTLRLTNNPTPGFNNIGTALDDLSFSEALLPGDTELRLTVDRASGAISLTNVGPSPANIKGYSITSEVGALESSGWRPIAGNYDGSGPGDGSVDDDDTWTQLSTPGSGIDLSEFEFGGDGGTLAVSQTVQLSLPGGGAWGKSPTEDIELEVSLADGRVNRYSVDYVNGPTGGYETGDLNFDGVVNALDWPLANSGRGADLSDLTEAQAYRVGDLDGDRDNDIVDFVLFQNLFNAANGEGAFQAMLAVPEPTALALLMTAICCLGGYRGKRLAKSPAPALILAIGCFGCLLMAGSSQATTLTFADSPGDNADLPVDYGSNISTNSAAFVTSDGTGATPNIALTWAPTGTPETDNVLEFHSSSVWGNAGFNVPVLQFDLDTSSQTAPPADPTIDFTIDGGFTFQLHDFEIGNSTGQTAAPYAWNIDLIRLDDMQVVDTQTTAALGPGDRETVTFDFTGFPNTDYRLRFDDGGANTVNTVIDNLSFSQVMVDLASPKLIVNTAGGTASIVNDSGEIFEIDSYEIRSESGSLQVAGWQSLEDQDFEGNGPPGNGNGWEEAGGSGPNQLIESYLLGSSTLSDGMSPLSLGSVLAPGGEQDLEFLVHIAGTGGVLLPGDVEYVTISVDGDYNSDGIVNAADYTLWRDSLGSSGSGLPADGNNDGTVNQQDYQYWKARFGNTANGGGSVSVPEPSSLLVFLLAASIYTLFPRREFALTIIPRRLLVPSRLSLVTASLALVVCLIGTQCLADRTVDRLYLFGDNPDESASSGATVSTTLDSQSINSNSTDVDAQNLSASSAPTYVNVGPTGLARPGASSGSLAIQFDGTDDRVDGVPLNRPDETAGPTPRGVLNGTPGPIIANFPFNYDKITARGLQMWVYPDQSAIGNGRQTIVSDTIAAGGVTITSDGLWSQLNDSKVDEGQIPASVPVVGDQWYHVMHHIYRSEDPNGPQLAGNANTDNGFTAIVYVDGVAVSANNGTPRPGEADNGNRVDAGLSVGAEETSRVFFSSEYTNHFTGVVDDLEMYVFGDNSSVTTSPAGQDYGTFNLLEDNGWIADRIAVIPGGELKQGDITLDGNVDNADVNALVAGWQREKVLSGSVNELLVGDWETRGWGDLNIDGIVDLEDAILLNDALISSGAGGLDFSRLGAVPEPATVLLFFSALACATARRRGPGGC